jgi:hypothetical protein
MRRPGIQFLSPAFLNQELRGIPEFLGPHFFMRLLLNPQISAIMPKEGLLGDLSSSREVRSIPGIS